MIFAETSVAPWSFLYDAASYIKEAASQAMEDVSANHYSLPKGRIRLRKAVAEHFSESYNLGRPLDAENEVLISAGGLSSLVGT